jgi:hypothetical protein
MMLSGLYIKRGPPHVWSGFWCHLAEHVLAREPRDTLGSFIILYPTTHLPASSQPSTIGYTLILVNLLSVGFVERSVRSHDLVQWNLQPCLSLRRPRYGPLPASVHNKNRKSRLTLCIRIYSQRACACHPTCCLPPDCSAASRTVYRLHSFALRSLYGCACYISRTGRRDQPIPPSPGLRERTTHAGDGTTRRVEEEKA